VAEKEVLRSCSNGIRRLGHSFCGSYFTCETKKSERYLLCYIYFFFIFFPKRRKCLGHVLREKMNKCKNEGKEGPEIEEFLKTLLDNEVKPLWPKGWMQSRYAV